jgi:hypothetical protein
MTIEQFCPRPPFFKDLSALFCPLSLVPCPLYLPSRRPEERRHVSEASRHAGSLPAMTWRRCVSISCNVDRRASGFSVLGARSCNFARPAAAPPRHARRARRLCHSARKAVILRGDARGGRLHQILGVRGRRGHTTSRRELNPFKPLRRHFPATRLAARPSGAAGPAAEAPRLERPSIGSSSPAFAGRAARCAPTDRLQAAAGRNVSDGTGHSAFSLRAAPLEQIWNTRSSLSRYCFVKRLGSYATFAGKRASNGGRPLCILRRC